MLRITLAAIRLGKFWGKPKSLIRVAKRAFNVFLHRPSRTERQFSTG